MREPAKRIYVNVHQEDEESTWLETHESEYEAANSVEGDDTAGPIFIYEQVAGPFSAKIHRSAELTPIPKKRRRKPAAK